MRDLELALASAAAAQCVRDTSDELGFNPTLLARVLDLRAQHARDGNRRRLFAALDEVVTAELPAWRPTTREDTRGAVRLRRLTLRNWKVFEHADLIFPEHSADKPVVLIGGKNGYGKTSLLEALQFGLLGVLALVEGALGEATPASRNNAYRSFIERALHRPSRDRGETRASVRSDWDTPEGRLVIERRWYFDEELRFTPEDEALTLWTGEDLEPLTVPTDLEPTLFYQQEIERRVVPASLAGFVFFDGEGVRRFSERRFSEQVRLAAEAVMGLAAWREAAADLKAYARDRARGLSRSEAGLESAGTELLARESEHAELEDRLAALEAQRRGPRDERDRLLAQLAPLESGTFSSLHELLERQQALSQDLARARHEFASAASTAAPLAFAPMALQERLAGILRAEAERTAPWRDLFVDGAARAAFLDALETELGIGADQALAAATRAWDGLRDAPHATGPLTHDYLGGQRTRVVQALGAPADDRMSSFERRIGELEAGLAAAAEGLCRHRQRDVESGRIRAQLTILNASLAQLDTEADTVVRRRTELVARLEELRAVALAAVRSGADVTADRSQRALLAALAVERLVDAVRPLCFEALGERVTEAYRALAHKHLVESVTFAANGDVALLDGHGKDLMAGEVSAGESQIFAMSLLAAVGDLASRELPVVIDTPLGRLDPDHRERILRYFTQRPLQTVLLSQPDEVNGRYLAMIESRVATRFRLDHSASGGGQGGSTPTPNAYPELAA